MAHGPSDFSGADFIPRSGGLKDLPGSGRQELPGCLGAFFD